MNISALNILLKAKLGLKRQATLDWNGFHTSSRQRKLTRHGGSLRSAVDFIIMELDIWIQSIRCGFPLTLHLGEYIPAAPVSDEARKHNENLPGMGGVSNRINGNLICCAFVNSEI